MLFAADLHIHTALSPCAEGEMTPPAIVEAAIREGLAMIAICDHNAAGNVAAVWSAGFSPSHVGSAGFSPSHVGSAGFSPSPRNGERPEGRTPNAERPEGRTPCESRLAVIAGMEITTAEEVHVLGLFPGPWAARAAAEEVRATLPPATAASSRFGEQRLLDADGEVLGRDDKMLSAASALDLSAAIGLIHRRNGLAIAAHIDRPAFGVIGQLGFWPADAGFDAAEVSAMWGKAPRWNLDEKAQTSLSLRPEVERVLAMGLPVVRCSDSHFLSDIGACRTAFELQAPTFGELALALRGLGGRRCHCA